MPYAAAMTAIPNLSFARSAAAILPVPRRARWGLLLALGVLGWAPASAAAAAAAEANPEAGLRILDPRGESTTTTRAVAHVLGRIAPGSKVWVEGQAAEVFATGIFARDNVPLQLGENQLRVVATTPDGQKHEQVVRVKREPEAAAAPEPKERRLAIDAESLEPAQNCILSRGDVLELSFRGTPGQAAEYCLSAGDWQPMHETRDAATGQPTGFYRAAFVAGATADTTNAPVRFRLRARPNEADGLRVAGGPVVEVSGRATVDLWDETRLRLVRVTEEGVGLSFGLHEVRLGGPYLAELPAGTLLRVTGMREGNYHVRLSPGQDGWIARRAVEWAPPGTPPPHLSFTSLSVGGNEAADLVAIPYSAPVPFAVTPARSAAGRAALEIDFYGAHHAATWISHRPAARVIREVTVQQVAAGHLRVSVELNGAQLWGYQWGVTNDAVMLRVRRPPKLAAAPGSPLRGLVLALEPGHGGSDSGARGVSGSQEKNINRWAVEELARQLEAAGARTVIVRPQDEALPLGARVRRAVAADADLFISVHANAAGHARGYLSVSGTSTYYKWPFCRDLSAAIHARLLEITRLNDFGNVGNFNYYPLRANTWMPTVLVEQAFMTHPGDEAKMLDPEFRREMMRAVLLGAEDWLKRVRAEARD